MNNNDILRQLRYALSLNNEAMMAVFEKAGMKQDLPSVIQLLKATDDPTCLVCDDRVLLAFLDGLILTKRGPNPNQSSAPQSETLTNNLVLKKIRIALELKEEDMLAIMMLADFKMSKYELSALFRRADHKNFRPCGNQILRNFLRGLVAHCRPS